MGDRRDTCKLGHFVNKYCRKCLIDLRNSPKMIQSKSKICTGKISVQPKLSLTLAY